MGALPVADEATCVSGSGQQWASLLFQAKATLGTATVQSEIISQNFNIYFLMALPQLLGDLLSVQRSRCSALPVADKAEHKRVQGSIADAADLLARKISGTPNG